MDKLREFGFPVALIVAWMAAAAYTVSLLISTPETVTAPPAEPPAVAASSQPAS